MTILVNQCALLIIDVQKAFVQRDQRGDARCNPDAESNISRLLSFFREHKLSIKHIHHHSLTQDSLFRSDLSGAQVQEFVKPMTHEAVYTKNANSGFIGTSLEQDLRANEISSLILCGATANHCVETTTRMAGNLGFNAFFVSDAVWSYDMTGPDGRLHRAADILSMTMANLQDEFAEVVSTEKMLVRLQT